MASNRPEVAKLQDLFESVKIRYAIFRWGKRIAGICLGTIAATLVIVGVSVACSFRSHSAQFRALRIGWPVLRTSAAIQVLGQGVLAVALSFWVTALLFEVYIIKLVAVIACLAIGATIALWKAIFTKIDNRCEVSGERISEAEAPALWQRIRELANRLNTTPPDQIIAGIAPNFFVTEHPVVMGEQTLEGRTLYLCLPMLKILSMDEADAVLGHELAHFSGNDTLWGRKISPLTGKFEIYLHFLSDGLSRMIAHFMFCFWKLYHISIRRLSRQREFRADQLGAEATSKDCMMRALVKIASYCEFRRKTETAIINASDPAQSLNLSHQLEQGYAAFLSSYVDNDDSLNSEIPHPFDTHPTLKQRMTHLGCETHAALRSAEIQHVVPNSWHQAISTGRSIEQRLWSEIEKKINDYQNDGFLWRLQPKGDDDVTKLEEHFPPAVFSNEKGAQVTLAYDRVQFPECEDPIYFKDIIYAITDVSWRRRRLTIRYRRPDASKPIETTFFPTGYVGEQGELLPEFSRYYRRHQTAETQGNEPVEA